MKRVLTIRLGGDWKGGLRRAARKAKARHYQGEELTFENAGAFFGQLTARRWDLIGAVQGQGALTIRAIAGRVERDVKRVHEDVSALVDLGVFEKGDDGVVCPFDRIHVDLEIAVPA